MAKRAQSREELLETIKTEALRDSQLVSSKKRFGLFNYQTPIAICDSEIAKSKPLRDSNGQVITQPRNIQTTIVKSGKVKSSYLSVPSFITIGDQYVDPDRLTRLYELEKKMKIPKDQPVFKPSSSYKIISGSVPYKHETDLNEKKRLSRIDSERLFQYYHLQNVNQQIKQQLDLTIQLQNSFKGPYRSQIKYPHLKDEYERLQEAEKKLFMDHQAKMRGKPAFSNADIGNRIFLSDRKTYEVTEKMRRVFKILVLQNSKKKEKPQTKMPILIHEQPFKYPSPGKKGYNRTINRYPQYMASPAREPVRRRVSVEDQKRDAFKVGHPNLLTGPSSTISCSYLNLRKEIQSSSAIQFKN